MLRREGGAEDDRTTWTGKRIRADGKLEKSEEGGGVGKYLKQAMQNPWEEFLEKHPIGTAVEGEVKNATEFGLFLGLDNDVDGMVHLSDIDWNMPGEEAIL